MVLLGIDIGTTHSKAGMFQPDGTVIAIAARATVSTDSGYGYSCYSPEQMWSTVMAAVQEVMTVAAAQSGTAVASIGIASMAESGLLISRKSGKPLSPFIPWHDSISAPQAKRIALESDPLERFKHTGMHNSYKLGLSKLLWIKEQQFGSVSEDAVWLTAAGYIAYRLTGSFASDYTLAARTYAYSIADNRWETEWISALGLPGTIFPEASPSGAVIGKTAAPACQMGLSSNIPVAIAGHDHVAAALAVGSIETGIVYDSMGTAETLVGTLPIRELGEHEFATGLAYGPHIADGQMFWMGGSSASGGSIEWIRGIMADQALSYERMRQLLDEAQDEPTGIIYYPYLSGRGAPDRDPKAKAAFIGLTHSHTKGDMLRAVLEGTAYQLAVIRAAAEQVTGRPIHSLVAVGGGTRNPHWLQIKADVLGCQVELPPIEEATLLGAALAAAIGSGYYADARQATAAVSIKHSKLIKPRDIQHRQYLQLFKHGYEALQAPLRQYYRLLADEPM